MELRIAILGYGSMGKMILQKISASGIVSKDDLFVANRTVEKLKGAEGKAVICGSNAEAARDADLIFVCVRPVDIRTVLEEIRPVIKETALLVSLNGSVTFENIKKIIDTKTAKMIPSVTAEIDRSQSLVCYNDKVTAEDKAALHKICEVFGNVIELPESEIGMGSELVSCMPGFIASIFDVICTSAKAHTNIPDDQIVNMVLNTLSATSDLMLEKKMSFEDVVGRVATKGGITEEGAKVIYEGFPETADQMFVKTLEKRRATAQKARELFESN